MSWTEYVRDYAKPKHKRRYTNGEVRAYLTSRLFSKAEWNNRWPQVDIKEVLQEERWRIRKRKLEKHAPKESKKYNFKSAWVPLHRLQTTQHLGYRPTPMHVHHLDGNPLNNREANLRVVPASVHALLHAFKISVADAWKLHHMAELLFQKELETVEGGRLAGSIQPSVLITKQVLAEYLGVTRRTVYRDIERGRLIWTFDGIMHYVNSAGEEIEDDQEVEQVIEEETLEEDEQLDDFPDDLDAEQFDW